MTDPAASGPSPAPARRPRRRHPALGSRIAVTGISAATMFGIVAVIGAGAGQDSTGTDETALTPSSTVTVPPVTTTVPTTPVPTTEPVPVTELSNEPIQLTAEPDVRVVETPEASAAPAQQDPVPEASTNGSR